MTQEERKGKKKRKKKRWMKRKEKDEENKEEKTKTKDKDKKPSERQKTNHGDESAGKGHRAFFLFLTNHHMILAMSGRQT